MQRLIENLSNIQIENFFKQNAPLTQEECDREAERITGETGSPSTVQGGTSYTFITATYAVQFCNAEFALDLDFLERVEAVYAGFVPHHTKASQLGSVSVYRMNNIRGVAVYLVRDELQADSCRLLKQSIRDYARFFASAWRNRTTGIEGPNCGHLLAEYSAQLAKLQAGLPQRFHKLLDFTIARLPALFDDNWPLVPNHIDLLENNIHMDPQTGHITGICDWADAEITPFRMSLAGLSTMLGTHGTKGWRCHANHQELRRLFWRIFFAEMGSPTEEDKERVEVARLVAPFCRMGLHTMSKATSFLRARTWTCLCWMQLFLVQMRREQWQKMPDKIIFMLFLKHSIDSYLQVL